MIAGGLIEDACVSYIFKAIIFSSFLTEICSQNNLQNSLTIKLGDAVIFMWKYFMTLMLP